MSYRYHGLGQTLSMPRLTMPAAQRVATQEVKRQQAAAAAEVGLHTQAANARLVIVESESILPPWCAGIWRDVYTIPPTIIPAGKPYVISWVQVKSDNAANGARLLDALGIGRGAPIQAALAPARGIAGLGAAITESSAEWPKYADGAPMSPAMVKLLVTFSDIEPALLTGGWIPDAESNPSFTRGVLWLGVADRQARHSTRLRLFLQAWLAMGLAGTPSVQVTGQTIVTPSMADGQSPAALVQSAYDSAIGMAEFTGFLRSFLTANQVSSMMRRLAQGVSDAAAKVARAAQILGSLDAIEAAVDGAIATAKGMEPPTDGAPLLTAQLGIVRSAKAALPAGVAMVPGVLRLAGDAWPQLKTELRTTILDAANANIERFPFSMGRDFARCGVLKFADTTLVGTRDRLRSALSASVASAQAISDPPAIEAALARLGAMEEKLLQAERELGLNPAFRHFGPLLGWQWALIGTGVFVGGAFGIRALRRRGKKSTVVAKNRRRRRRLR